MQLHDGKVNQSVSSKDLPAEFMELMEFRFHDKAKKNGCFVVSAAGFDSIPADLGVLYTMQQFQAPAVPSSVTSFLSFQIGNAGMCGERSGSLVFE